MSHLTHFWLDFHFFSAIFCRKLRMPPFWYAVGRCVVFCICFEFIVSSCHIKPQNSNCAGISTHSVKIVILTECDAGTRAPALVPSAVKLVMRNYTQSICVVPRDKTLLVGRSPRIYLTKGELQFGSECGKVENPIATNAILHCLLPLASRKMRISFC